MTIEEELFRRTKINLNKISKYGFKKEKNLYKYSKNIMNNAFRVDVEINDIVYLYVGKPYSSIMYKFKVTEVNIPYEYKDENLKMQKVMKIDLIERYKKGKLSFNKLKDFGINAIRGPRYMPLELSKYINKLL